MTHPDVGRLLAWLDGDLDDADAPGVRSHLDACAPCRTRLEQLESDSRRVSTWLREADLPAPPAGAYERPWRGAGTPAAPSRSRRPWLRVAAAAAALALVVGPARAWIRHALTPDAPAPVEAPRAPAPAPQEAPVATTSFRPASPTVTLRIGPAGGVVRIRLEAVSGDRVELWSPWDDLDVTVLPDQLDLAGLDRRAGTLRLGVPAGVRRIVVVTASGERRAIPTDPSSLPHVTGPGGGAPDADGDYRR